MTILMIDESDIVEDELLLHDDDYPINYINKHHPDDYKITSHFIQSSMLFHKKSHRNRLILRISWKIDNGFVPMSFICDTGAPMYFYLSPMAKQLIAGRIISDELQTEYVELIDNNNVTFKAHVTCSPGNHSDVNIIGLLLLSKLGLSLSYDRFDLNKCPNYF